MTVYNKNGYNEDNRGSPVKCECGQIVAYKKNGKLMVYCKRCKRQIPFVVDIDFEPEPRARATRS